MSSSLIVNQNSPNAVLVSDSGVAANAILSTSDENTAILGGASSSTLIIENDAAPSAIVIASEVGAQGPPGPVIGFPTFIQSTAPTVLDYAGYTKYAWFDTSGGDLTLWIEDGA